LKDFKNNFIASKNVLNNDAFNRLYKMWPYL